MTERPDKATSGPIGYVLKVFPRISETFVINEMLAMESFGERVRVLPCHHPPGVVHHETLGLLRAPVAYAEDYAPEEIEVGRARKRLAKRFSIDESEEGRFLPRKYVRLALGLAHHARKHGVVHLHAHFASRSAHVAALAAALLDCPYSVTAHAKDIYHDEVDADVLRWKIRNAAFVATVTEFNLRFLQQLTAATLGCADKLVRVYNGVDLSRFHATPVPRDRRPLILGVGRLIEKKGFEHLIAACRILVDRGRELDCEIVGGGELTDPLQQQIEAAGLGDVVKLCGGLPTEAVAQRMRDAFVLALPCVVGKDGNVDALPTVIIEAMASARAVVSTRVSGIPEMIVEGETGLLCEPGDARGLADALEALLVDPAGAEAMGIAGRKRAEALFDLYTNARTIRDLIRSRGSVGSAA
jgi:glycosyltransferase involved in cell wall biosynthesis